MFLFYDVGDMQVTEYSHVITGYVVSVDFLRELANIVKDIKEHNKDVVYCKYISGYIF